MTDKDNKRIITKDEIRKEIRSENKKYRRKKRMATFAILLVLVALILVYIYASKKGIITF